MQSVLAAYTVITHQPQRVNITQFFLFFQLLNTAECLYNWNI